MLIIRDVRDIINEDTESFCSYKSWTTYTEQESDLRSNNSWCDVDADEKDEDLNVTKLLDRECFTGSEMAAAAY